MKIVILAGGGGTRFWPLSREQKPKQFCQIVGDKTMYEQTIERMLQDYDLADIFVCLNEKLLPLAREIYPKLPEKNYILEPEKRDTAPAMGYVAAYLYTLFPDEPIVFVPADHYIGDQEKFLQSLQKADQLIRQTGKMLDIAIAPNFPSTVLGYTQIGEKFSSEDGIEVYQFKGHVEKPKIELAQQYLQQGDYLWHANYYMWTPRKILQAFQTYSPEHYQFLEKIVEGFQENNLIKVKDNFQHLPKISFDYAITEKMDPNNVLIIKGDFAWNDVGAFDVLYDAKKENDLDNVTEGKVVILDSQKNLVYNYNSDKVVAAIGLEDLIVIDDKDVLLICPKNKAQDVKKIITELKANNLDKYL